MPDTISIGDYVKTNQYGEGQVIEISGSSAIVNVRGSKITQPIESLKIIKRGETNPPRPPTENADINRNQSTHIRNLESLRFGLVPLEKIDELTIGYDDLKSWVSRLLPHNNNNRPKVGTVIGNYGTGKSHTLSVVRHIAKEENYVTANIEVDGVMVKLSDPETVLSALWTQLEANDLCSATPLLEIYLKAIRRDMNAPVIAVSGIDRINHNYDVIKFVLNGNHLDELEEELNAIVSSHNEYSATEVTQLVKDLTKDRYKYVRRMIGRTVDERPYDFVESLFGHSKVCTLAGYKGLVITIDEFEIQNFDKYRDRANKLLQILNDYLAGNTRYNPVPCTLIFGQVPDIGNRANEYIENVINASAGLRRQIAEIDKNQCMELAKKIFDIYKEAYLLDKERFRLEQAEKSYNRIVGTSGRIRAFIKDYIASLDNEYF